MQKCKKCHFPFGWWKIYRTVWGLMYKPVNCEKCGTGHDITIFGRLVNTLLVIFPLTIFAGILAPFDNIYLDLGAGIALAFLGSLLVPYLIIFKVEGKNLYSE